MQTIRIQIVILDFWASLKTTTIRCIWCLENIFHQLMLFWTCLPLGYIRFIKYCRIGCLDFVYLVQFVEISVESGRNPRCWETRYCRFFNFSRFVSSLVIGMFMGVGVCVDFSSLFSKKISSRNLHLTILFKVERTYRKFFTSRTKENWYVRPIHSQRFVGENVNWDKN